MEVGSNTEFVFFFLEDKPSSQKSDITGPLLHSENVHKKFYNNLAQPGF